MFNFAEHGQPHSYTRKPISVAIAYIQVIWMETKINVIVHNMCTLDVYMHMGQFQGFTSYI